MPPVTEIRRLAMQLRTIATFAVAIALGLIAVVLVRGYLSASGSNRAVASTVNGVPVVVAASPIERGVSLQPALLKVVRYPADSVPAGAFTDVAALTGAGEPRLALRSLAANEPVLPAKISGAGGKATLSGTLSPGMRAISVRSNDVAGVGGFVLPGDRIDVLVTRPASTESNPPMLTQVLAENVRVLGVDQSDDVDADKPVVAKAVTIEVSPAQAQSISLAQQVGSVTLSLRQIADEALQDRKVTTFGDLGGGAKAASSGHRTARRPGTGHGGLSGGMTEVKVTRGVEISGYPVRAE
jgi:pilus assembly protein CpaB